MVHCVLFDSSTYRKVFQLLSITFRSKYTRHTHASSQNPRFRSESAACVPAATLRNAQGCADHATSAFCRHMVARSPLSLLCSLGRGSRLRTIVGLRIPSRVSLSFGSPVGRPELFGRRDSDYRSDGRVAEARSVARLAEPRPRAAGGSQPHQPGTVPPSTTYAYIICVACPLSIQFVRGAFIPSCRSSARIELGARQSAPATQVSH